MKTKFQTFWPACSVTATTQLNEWLAEHPNAEIISWQTTPVGTTNSLYITIQYRELEET